LDIGGGGEQFVLEDGVVSLAKGAEGEGDWAIAQLDIACLAHDAISIGDGEIGESAMILFKPCGALCVGLARHLHTEIGELLVELFDLGLGLEMLEGAANGRVGETDGDGVKGASVKLGVSLHDIERALRGEGVVVAMDAGDDLAFFRLGIRGNGEVWAFGRGMDGLGGWCSGERNSGRRHVVVV
jgi:hypothetical protein